MTAAIFAAGVFIGSLIGLIVGLMIGARRRAEPVDHLSLTAPRCRTQIQDEFDNEVFKRHWIYGRD